MSEAVIEVSELVAEYGRGSRRLRAVDGFSLTVQRGEIFGLLGPNGAGKTTLLACIEGLHRPAAGTVRVAGIEVTADPVAVKRRLGIQLQRTALLDELTVGELVELYAALYEVWLTRGQIGNLLTRFDLADQRRRLARRLSGGQQQRLALAIALANDPEAVLLDEPTSALDPHARRAVWEIIRSLRAEGRTVLLTTHAMEEAAALCDRVAIIDRGRLVACGPPAELVADHGAANLEDLFVSLTGNPLSA